ncbi:MAG: hypothetical protein IB618_02100 [Candidatus Pacearchaeota archaeon]|nr:MAG: hypothetical protein IB618_02100 [Candidatus Pacearchaeota archaeon]
MEEQLRKVGLSNNEIKIYLNLIELGQSTATEIAHKTTLYRPYVYDTLKRLINKGLVSYVIKSGKKYFRAANPRTLLKNLQEKENLVKEILPRLLSLEKKPKEEQRVEIYEGKEGFKSYMKEFIKLKEVYGLGMRGKAWDILEYEMPVLVKKFIKNVKKARFIANEEARRYFSKFPKTIKTKYLPEEYGSPATTTIYGNKISISILYGKPFLIIIESKKIAQAYKGYFNLLWKIAKS